MRKAPYPPSVSLSLSPILLRSLSICISLSLSLSPSLFVPLQQEYHQQDELLDERKRPNERGAKERESFHSNAPIKQKRSSKREKEGYGRYKRHLGPQQQHHFQSASIAITKITALSSIAIEALIIPAPAFIASTSS